MQVNLSTLLSASADTTLNNLYRWKKKTFVKIKYIQTMRFDLGIHRQAHNLQQCLISNLKPKVMFAQQNNSLK